MLNTLHMSTSFSKKFGMRSFSVASFFRVGAVNNSTYKMKNKCIKTIKYKHLNLIKHTLILSCTCIIRFVSTMVHTGSTLSQLLYFPVKSKPKTCPQTDVILYETDSPVGGNFPLYSWMEQAPLEPFLEFICPPDNIFAID